MLSTAPPSAEQPPGTAALVDENGPPLHGPPHLEVQTHEVVLTLAASDDLGLTFTFPFVSAISVDGAAAAVPGLEVGMMLSVIETPAGQTVRNAQRLGEAAGM